jgi:hypothetical protein
MAWNPRSPQVHETVRQASSAAASDTKRPRSGLASEQPGARRPSGTRSRRTRSHARSRNQARSCHRSARIVSRPGSSSNHFSTSPKALQRAALVLPQSILQTADPVRGSATAITLTGTPHAAPRVAHLAQSGTTRHLGQYDVDQPPAGPRPSMGCMAETCLPARGPRTASTADDRRQQHSLNLQANAGFEDGSNTREHARNA